MEHSAGHTVNDDDDDDASVDSSALSDTCFSPTPSGSSHSSLDFDMRSHSVSPAPSVYSLTSSIREQSFRVEYGRSLNNYSEVYRLPADQEELERLDNQHDMLKEVMGKYAPPLPEVMADEPGVTKACLDLGCGSGVWIMQVAREWPNSSCVAVDLAPMQSTSIPPNCRSEVDDINLGLEHFYGAFDVVHARFVSTGIRNYYRMLDDISRVLRPRGLADLIEFDFRTYDVHGRPVAPFFTAWDASPETLAALAADGRAGGPWLPCVMAAATHAIRLRGGHFDAAALLHRWAAQHGALEDVVYREFWIPTMPWMAPPPGAPVPPELARWLRVACAMREDVRAFLKSGRPLMLGAGIPEAVVDLLEVNTVRELEEGRTPLLLRVQNVYFRKKAM